MCKYVKKIIIKREKEDKMELILTFLDDKMLEMRPYVVANQEKRCQIIVKKVGNMKD